MRIILYIIIVILPIFGSSQNSVEFKKANFKNNKSEMKSAILDYEDGDYYYNLGVANVETALDYYIKANTFNPNNALLNYKIGLCYLDIRPTSKAIYYFEKAYKLDTIVHEHYNYYYARALHINMQFTEAIAKYIEFKNNLSPQESEDFSYIINKNIDECITGIDMVSNPVRVSIINVGPVINSEYSDYGPVVNMDESIVFYTSRRPTTIGGKRSPEDMMFFEDVYWTISKDGKWLKSKNIGKPVNTEFHDAVVGISPDGNTLIIYRDDNGGDLFYSNRHGDNWAKPQPFPEPINSEFHETSASFSSNGKSLCFISDRPGGYGEKDIYYSDINKEGKYGKAINLGNTINTSENEIGVFAHADGQTIYFSSSAHKGMGSYDVYKSTLANNSWSIPENLGYPINTPYPEVFFSLSASGINAYYSSNREGGLGGKDIYKITYLGPKKEPLYSSNDQLLSVDKTTEVNANVDSEIVIKSSMLTLLKGIIVDEITQKPIESTIELIDNEEGEVLATFKSNSKTGKYVISLPSGNNYGLAIYAEDYLFYSDNFIVPKHEGYHEVVRNVSLQRVEIGKSISLQNIFFDYKKTNIISDSEVELNRIVKLMKKYISLRIEVQGHTDNVGGKEYNQNLSLRRAESVMHYIVSKGIAKSRISASGFGFSRPLSTNDTEKGRKKNRRSEIIIIGK